MRRQGDPDRAQSLLQEALQRNEQMSNAVRIGENLVYLGHAARNLGQLQVARSLYKSSLPHLLKSSYTRYISHVKTSLGVLEALQGRDDNAMRFFREGLGIAQKGNHRLCAVEALEEIADVCTRQGKVEYAVRMVAVSDTERERLSAPIPPVERERHEQVVNELRAALGDQVLDAIQSDVQTFCLRRLRPKF